jgi:hypothetical protein
MIMTTDTYVGILGRLIHTCPHPYIPTIAPQATTRGGAIPRVPQGPNPTNLTGPRRIGRVLLMPEEPTRPPLATALLCIEPILR